MTLKLRTKKINNLTSKERSLLHLVKSNPGLNTAQLAELNGTYRAYVSAFRDRLLRLEEKELVYHVSRMSVNHPDLVLERKWYAK